MSKRKYLSTSNIRKFLILLNKCGDILIFSGAFFIFSAVDNLEAKRNLFIKESTKYLFRKKIIFNCKSLSYVQRTYQKIQTIGQEQFEIDVLLYPSCMSCEFIR